MSSQGDKRIGRFAADYSSNSSESKRAQEPNLTELNKLADDAVVQRYFLGMAQEWDTRKRNVRFGAIPTP